MAKSQRQDQRSLGLKSRISVEKNSGANKLKYGGQEQKKTAQSQFKPDRQIGIVRAAFASDQSQIVPFLPKSLAGEGSVSMARNAMSHRSNRWLKPSPVVRFTVVASSINWGSSECRYRMAAQTHRSENQDPLPAAHQAKKQEESRRNAHACAAHKHQRGHQRESHGETRPENSVHQRF